MRALARKGDRQGGWCRMTCWRMKSRHLRLACSMLVPAVAFGLSSSRPRLSGVLVSHLHAQCWCALLVCRVGPFHTHTLHTHVLSVWGVGEFGTLTGSLPSHASPPTLSLSVSVGMLGGVSLPLSLSRASTHMPRHTYPDTTHMPVRAWLAWGKGMEQKKRRRT